jgi:2-oxoisovalerate dehydrogenase E2 component (dihydrolipoyl transacylase)
MLNKFVSKQLGKLVRVSRQNMAIRQFHLPDLGEKIKEAKVMKWLVKEGDMVEEYDDLADVTTDKLSTKIPSTYSGKIHRLLVEEEGFCNVGQVLLEIDDLTDDNGSTSDVSNEVEQEKKIAKQENVKEEEGNTQEGLEKKNDQIVFDPLLKTFSCPALSNKLDQLLKSNVVSAKPTKTLATPAVRALAKSLGINLDKVQSKDSSGRVTKEDVLAYQQALTGPEIKDEVQSKREDIRDKREETQVTKPVMDVSKDSFKKVEMSPYEQGMVKSMMSSLSVPDFLYHEEFDVTEIELLRHQINKSSDSKVSLFTMLIKTFSLALLQNPKLNSLYYYDSDPYSYEVHSDHNISIAIASSNGLVAPNIKQVQNLSIQNVKEEVDRLKALANKGSLGMNELGGGTICLSNIGTMGGTYTGPISLPNQTCIVGIGKVGTQLKYKGSKEDKMEILKKNIEWTPEHFEMREILYVSFAGDHRVIDGATMAKFSNDWKEIIENPMQLVTKMR